MLLYRCIDITCIYIYIYIYIEREERQKCNTMKYNTIQHDMIMYGII